MTHDSANANCRELLDTLVAQGVDRMIISPGSRNTPLTMAADAREELHKYVVNDERTAAFMALGYALVSQKPVILACTSGTALYNYSPAIAEAYYQHVPLIVITADRPSQWIDQDDSQTLKQFGALDNIVKRSFDIYADAAETQPCANPDFSSERAWFVNRVANEAYITSMSGHKGPVHINMQFANPLNSLTEYQKTCPRTVRVVRSDGSLSKETMALLAGELIDKKIMVVAGFMPPNHRLSKALRRFTELPGVTLLAETVANLHLPNHYTMVDSLLCRMSDEEKEKMRPDIVITIGGALISRMLKEYLRKCDGTCHWTLADTDVGVDCLHRLTTHIEASPEAFFSQVGAKMRKLTDKLEREPSIGYNLMWHNKRLQAIEANRMVNSRAPWSELKALDNLFASLPANFNLYLSNGTSIRYAQILMEKMPHACFCNRGVSGIDGSNASAYGAALAYNGPTLLITGDMSFAYCPEIMNLGNCGMDADLRIAVINNSGGGIFRFIASTRDLENRERYFCSDPQLPVRKLAEAYGWNYISVSSEGELAAATEAFLGTRRSIMEICVDPHISAETLINWFKNK